MLAIYVVTRSNGDVDSAWTNRWEAIARAAALTDPDHPQGPLGNLVQVQCDDYSLSAVQRVDWRAEIDALPDPPADPQ